MTNKGQRTKDKGEKIEKGMSLPDIPFFYFLCSQRDSIIPISEIF